MTTHTSATTREETPHTTELTSTITISDALRRRAQLVTTDISIDPQWRSVIRYALLTNDPWLGDLVRRADAGEKIIDTIDFSCTRETNNDGPTDQRIAALSEIICQAGEKSAAALFVLMGTLENSRHPKLVANTAKHFAFARCAALNLYGMVDAQINLVDCELLNG